MYQPEHSPGDMIHGRYKIISFISRGGFGETYKVEDTQRAGLICLLKYLRPQSSSPTVLRLAEEKFSQEADILRRLGSHNQIPQLYDYFEENLKFYLVEEYIDGQNLALELHVELFSESKVIEVLHDVLNILDYLSQNYVIHRDIKPENLIRRSSDNKIVLVDFGAVKEVGTLVVNAQGQTILTMAIGTPGFMAPEQLEGKPEFASDIYALGITAFFLLTRQIPSNNQYSNSIINGVQIQPYFTKIIENMVRYKYEERYQTATDVLTDLEPLTLLEQVLNQRYEIKSYLGGGGLSYTYFTQDKQRPYQANCIIKQLKLTHYNQRLLQEAQNRFLATVQLLRKLPAHQQIPQLSDHFQNNKKFYLVYDFIQGEPLSKQIISGRLSETEVIVLLKDVLEVLSFIHQHGVIHGDVKPSNLIKRQHDGKFCLINFADFKQITNLSFNGQNIVVTPYGTNGYMAPEQYQNKLQYCTDIYALGMTAIQALTGVSPEQLHTNSENEVIWQNQVSVSPKLARILNKMVRFQTSKRYQSAQNILDDLNSQTCQDKLEKYWKIIASIGVAISAGIIFIIYTDVQNERKVDLFNQGIDKNEEGDKKKSNGDNDGSNNAYDQAIKYFQEAIKIDSMFTNAWVNQGYAYGQRQKFAEQAYSCTQATIIDSNSSRAWLCLGNAQFASRRQYNDSITSFNRAATNSCNSSSVDPTCVAAWSNIGDAYLALNKPQEALDAYRKALNFDNNFLPALKGEKEAKKRLNKKY